MTAINAGSANPPRPEVHRSDDEPIVSYPVSFARVLRAERIRFLGLRSSWIVLAVAALSMIVTGVFIALNTRTSTSGHSATELGRSATLQGIYIAQLLVGSLGVLFVSGEFGSGAIRSTFSAVPTRVPVVGAKALVIATVSLATVTLASLVTFLVGQAVIGSQRRGYSLADGTSVRVVIGTSVYVALIAVLGSAIAWLVRSTAGALVLLFGLILVVPAILSSVLGDSAHVALNLLPTSGFSVAISPQPSNGYGPWSGLAVLIVWVVMGMVAATISVRTRDV